MSHRRNPHKPIRLRVETLEDRLTPAAGDVLVAFEAGISVTTQLTELNDSPYTESVTSLGFNEYRVDLKAGVDINAAITFFAGQPGVTMAGQDSTIVNQAIPSDPGYSSLWNLQKISAPTGWNVTTGTGQTIVAVIDTGIDYNHPDLLANMWVNPTAGAADRYGYDFANNDANPMDDNGHGTHVAGTIGAVGNNGVGTTGVAWKVKLMALKFMDSTGSGYTSDAIRAIDYAIAHGAKILNNSWGGGTPDSFLQAAIERAKAAGVIFVVAAGNETNNDDTTPSYPTQYGRTSNNVISVAATNSSDGLAYFSNYGAQTVLVAAPGIDIYSTLPGGGYGYKSGTSMATPVISGALALLWDLHPTWTYTQIINKLKVSVDSLTSLQGNVTTGGRINLAKLLDASTTTPPVTPPVSPPPPATSPPTTTPPVTAPPIRWEGSGPKLVAASWSGTSSNTVNTVRVTFDKRINTPTLTAADIVLKGPNGNVITVTGVTVVANSGNAMFDITFATQSTSGTYTITVGPDVWDVQAMRMDQNGNGINGEAADKYTGSTTLGNSPPVSPPTSPPVSPPTTSRKNYSATGLPIAIADQRTTRVTLNVTDSFTINDLKITLDIAHARLSDLNVRLRGPNDQLITLYNRRGVTLTNVTFDDSAALSLTSSSIPDGASVKPEQVLSALKGANAKGIWTIEVFDLVAGSTGTIRSVTLSFGSASLASVTNVQFAPVYMGPQYSIALNSLFGNPMTDALFSGKPDQLVAIK